jgi:hypothetical protein
MSETSHVTPAPSRPMGLVLGLFIAGTIITVLVGYLGVSGTLGGGIPGTSHTGTPTAPGLSSCEGKDTLGNFQFVLSAGAGGGLRFNTSSPGPCFAVAVGSHVTITLNVLISANRSVSWVLINGTGPTTEPPVLPGAGASDSSRFSGIFPGHNVTYSFVASTAGQFRYVSEVGNEAAVGMWGAFTVTSAPASLALPHGETAPSLLLGPGPSSSSGLRAAEGP